VFVAVGNLFVYLCLAVTLIILGAALLGSRRARETTGPVAVE
jgi:hypothetical protein